MSVPPNEVIYEKDFWRDVHGLPNRVQDKLGSLIEILRENPFDSRLHTKPLSPPLQEAFSFRITRDYRVALVFPGPRVIKLLMADARGNIYRRLTRKL